MRIFFVVHSFGDSCKISTWLGSDWSTLEEHKPHDRKVVSSKPTGWWDFFSLFYSISCVSLIKSLTEVHHYWRSLQNMVSRAAWGEASFVWTDWTQEPDPNWWKMELSSTPSWVVSFEISSGPTLMKWSWKGRRGDNAGPLLKKSDDS